MLHRIDWRHDGRRIVLPILILRPDPSRDLSGFQAEALIDTGSTTSGITPRVAEFLDLPKRGKRPLGSAQGEGQAERYLFRIALPLAGEIPNLPFVFDDVSGFELASSFVLDALVGMDILRQCGFSINPQRRCVLQFG